ncbi:MAG: siphovirus Gp157 family protein [bacterium]|nr:siphovirus Gp157 family protein [bacterium]
MTNTNENLLALYGERNLKIQELSLELVKAQAELKASELYQKTLALQEEITTLEAENTAFKDKIKSDMENGGVKKLELQNVIFTLKESVGSLIVEDEKVVDESYFDTKKSLNKTRLKKDISNGAISYPGVYIQKTNSLLITEK